MTRKQAVVIVLSTQPIVDPASGRQGMLQKEFTKVFPINTTLEELLQYAGTKSTNKVNITFESEEPEERPHSREEREEDEKGPEAEGERRGPGLDIVERTGGSPEEGPDREGSH